MFQGPDEHIKIAGDVLAGTLVVASLADWLPPVAAFFALVYTAIRIYESYTVQRIIARMLGRTPPTAPWKSGD
jgi:hypothetical protein